MRSITPSSAPHSGSTSTNTKATSSSSESSEDKYEKNARVLQFVLDLEQLDVNLYRGFSPEQPRWGRVYGGQTVAQAVVAASRTVDEKQFVLESIHSYFLRPGNDDLPILYYVSKSKSSKNFQTRSVLGVQHGATIFSCNVQYHKPEEGCTHQVPMPNVPTPDALPLWTDVLQKFSVDPSLPKPIQSRLRRSSVLPIPFEQKYVDSEEFTAAHFSLHPPKRKPAVQLWMKVKMQLHPNDLLAHQCSLAYISDWGLLSPSMRPHSMSMYDPSVHPASLDHSIWFHDKFRADEWLLYDMESLQMRGNRTLCIGKVFTQDGRHVATCVQEGLIRKVANSLVKPPAGSNMNANLKNLIINKNNSSSRSSTTGGESASSGRRPGGHGQQLQAKL